MDWLAAFVLGLVQGLTEFLPVSSSAHLRIVGEWFGGDPGATFTAITQIGTEAAVVIYVWNDIVRILKAWFGSFTGKVTKDHPDVRMGWYIIIGTLPIVILGVLLQGFIRDQFRSLWFVGATLIIFGVILGVADVLGKKVLTLENLTVKHGIIYGFAQALALIPGVSRSGGTITAGRLLGYDRPSAARYGFLLAIPAVFGSGLHELVSALKDGTSTGLGWGPTMFATIVAGVVGWFVIKYFMRYIENHSFMPFVLYRIVIGTIILMCLAFGILNPLSGVHV